MAPSRSADPWSPMPALPLGPQDYYGLLRTERYRWWRGLLGIVLLLFGWLVVGGVLGSIGLAVDLVRGDVTLAQLTMEEVLAGRISMGPAFFIANNLGLAALVPLSMLLNRVLFGQRAGWLSSVAGRFRWRWLLWCLLLVGVPWLVYYLVEMLVVPVGGAPVALSGSVVVLLLLTLVTTPLQSAGEEWAFRGFIPRCIAAMVPDPRIGLGLAALLGAALFMLIHLAHDPWLNLFYFGFGLLQTALVWRTGGLEAAVTLHAVNNLVGLVPIVLTGQLGTFADRSAGAGDWSVLVPMVLGTVLVVVVDRMARRRGVARLFTPTAPGVPSGWGSPVGGSDIGAPRVTLEPYEHRDDPHPGAGDRRA
ncbi:Membrane protease YdiL, CAAX protease family [Raineyella antarctica]|uniref:Membrane protease YdiL, CAAX protease family n=1 Tax=Raineyella antarctica TaxID=1577474 RepID=A0A1G6H1R9_9ACTN|nr:CPBP family intramembrane glutamic endopeptidase [Raineyella antarctica]SDB88088.1 Membrane protease YdiL, CAAX protease family [Raineyella antarctica]